MNKICNSILQSHLRGASELSLVCFLQTSYYKYRQGFLLNFAGTFILNHRDSGSFNHMHFIKGSYFVQHWFSLRFINAPHFHILLQVTQNGRRDLRKACYNIVYRQKHDTDMIINAMAGWYPVKRPWTANDPFPVSRGVAWKLLVLRPNRIYAASTFPGAYSAVNYFRNL